MPNTDDPLALFDKIYVSRWDRYYAFEIQLNVNFIVHS